MKRIFGRISALIMAAAFLSALSILPVSMARAAGSTGVKLADKFFFPYASREKSLAWDGVLRALKEAGYKYREVEGTFEVFDPDNPGYVLCGLLGNDAVVELYYFDENPPTYKRLNGIKVEFHDCGDLYFINVDLEDREQVDNLGDVEAYLREIMPRPQNTSVNTPSPSGNRSRVVADAEDREALGDRLSTESLPKEELTAASKETLAYLRNRIYANHGYAFKNKQWRDEFARCDWYRPNPNFSEKLFNSYEKDNLNKIMAEEKRR
jgi:hypothetical protein